MLCCQFLCHVLKALFFITVALKLSYFCKKNAKFSSAGGSACRPPEQPPYCRCLATRLSLIMFCTNGLRQMGWSFWTPKTAPPTMQKFGYAPDTTRVLLKCSYFPVLESCYEDLLISSNNDGFLE